MLNILLLALVPLRAAAENLDGKLPVLTVVERTAEPVLKADQPWEDFCVGWANVIRDGDGWHMWYEGYDHNYHDDGDGYLCYAHSDDGVHWQKPNLGLVEYDGDCKNNIVLSGPAIGGAHGHTVFVDEAAPPAERYKAVFSKFHNKSEWWVYGAVSPDCLHWTPLPEPLLKKNSDTETVCFRDGDVYRLYVRMWTGGTFSGKRVVGYCESPTFGQFPDPTVILGPDEDDPADLHFYNSAATKLPCGLHLMLPSGFFTSDGSLPVYAALSSDGKQYTRLGREPLLPLGKGFDSKGIYVGPGAIPGPTPGTYWFYYLGTPVAHDDNDPAKIHDAGGIGRFLLRVE